MPRSQSTSGESVPVALCITELEIGGAENNLVELALRLDRARFAPIVYSLKSRPADDGKSCVPRLERAGIPVYFLDVSGPFTLLRGLFRLRHFFRAHGIRIAQSFLFHANILGRFAAWLAGVPCRLSGVRVAEREKRSHLVIDYWTQRLVGKYVCVSEGVAGHIEKQGGIAPKKITVIPNGIDAEPYDNAVPADLSPVVPFRIGDLRGSRNILLIGRLHRQKGFDWFLATLPRWMSEAPGWEVLIVGDGPERDRLLARLRQADLARFASRVHFLGWRSDIPRLLAASDILALPSRWEGMPNVVLQAMSAGLPVLATDVEGVAELLPSPEPICPFGETAAWSAKLLGLIRSEETRRAWGEANRARARTEFSFDKMAAAYQAIWEECLARRREPPAKSLLPQESNHPFPLVVDTVNEIHGPQGE